MHTEERAASTFATLDLRGAVDVTIKRGDTTRLVVVAATAKDAARVITRQRAGHLEIESMGTRAANSVVITTARGRTVIAGGGSIAVGGDVVIHHARSVFGGPVTVVCAGDIHNDTKGDTVRLAGAAPRVELTVPTVPTIRATGAGDVLVEDAQQESLQVVLFGSGDIRLTGKVGILALGLKGSGDIDAEELDAKGATIMLQGSGDIRANVSEKVSIELSGSGDITIAGNPPRRDTCIRSSGDVSFQG